MNLLKCLILIDQNQLKINKVIKFRWGWVDNILVLNNKTFNLIAEINTFVKINFMLIKIIHIFKKIYNIKVK